MTLGQGHGKPLFHELFFFKYYPNPIYQWKVTAQAKIFALYALWPDFGDMILSESHTCNIPLGDGQYPCKIVSRSEKGVKSRGSDKKSRRQTDGQADMVISVYPVSLLHRYNAKLLSI